MKKAKPIPVAGKATVSHAVVASLDPQPGKLVHGCSGFSQFARRASQAAGRPITFALAVGIIVVWAVVGPLFHFSDTWQLVINTGTTIITFLMVFLIQNSQNRDSEAIQVKLNELIRAMHGARNALIDVEDADDEELEELRTSQRRLREAAQVGVRSSENGVGTGKD